MPEAILLDALRVQPLVAILRGIAPPQAIGVAGALYEAGIRVVEVPLNSPEPFESIARIAAEFAGRLVVGAGTVLSGDEVEQVAAAGGRIVLSPNFSAAVIRASLRLGLVPVPGIATPSEAFAALDSGARVLKVFPAASLGPGFLRQLGAVLPPVVKMLAVGGVNEKNMRDFQRAGAAGFGIGAALFTPGDDLGKVAEVAARYVDACRQP